MIPIRLAAAALLLAACVPASTPPPASARPPTPTPAAAPPAAPSPAPVAGPTPTPTPAPTTTPAPAPSKPAPKAPSAVQARPAPAPAPPPAPAAPAMDLKALEQRLKDTDAIGVLTKLSLKNQVDELVGRFRSFHSGQRPPTLEQLRPSFELLLMKALSLLQDKDPGLAKDIDASRAALWTLLADPAKFARLR